MAGRSSSPTPVRRSRLAPSRRLGCHHAHPAGRPSADRRRRTQSPESLRAPQGWRVYLFLRAPYRPPSRCVCLARGWLLSPPRVAPCHRRPPYDGSRAEEDRDQPVGPPRCEPPRANPVSGWGVSSGGGGGCRVTAEATFHGARADAADQRHPFRDAGDGSWGVRRGSTSATTAPGRGWSGEGCQTRRRGRKGAIVRPPHTMSPPLKRVSDWRTARKPVPSPGERA